MCVRYADNVQHAYLEKIINNYLSTTSHKNQQSANLFPAEHSLKEKEDC